ncbi:MAG: hypothetical protein RJA70_3830 [Pseudomonadota bacterium]|jgi:uncharacterized protein YbaP (TraB family)
MSRSFPAFRSVFSALLLIALWAGGLVPGCASTPDPTTASQATPAPQEKPLFLWKVESDSATVHVLGSVHVGSPELYPLDPRIEAAFAGSDVLVLEIDMDDEAMADAAVRMTQVALLPKGENLDDHLNEATRKLLHEKLDLLQINPAQIQMFKPWFAAMMITMREIEAAGFDGELGIEQHFLKRAQGTKELSSLESISDQITALEAYTEGTAAESLRQALEMDSAAYFRSMLTAWRLGDSRQLDLMLDEARKYPESYAVMFTNRNIGMANKIEGYLNQNKTFFVVAGAGHMVGKDSVVDLLQKRGHKLVQAR